ncbi:ATP-binding protein [Rapidithrix thailandica]|uniref:histidine kinase n=1 Tax=Rapidithrix thailandica TaxID=413964 RepID=A0AAW9SDL3_9BACT
MKPLASKAQKQFFISAYIFVYIVITIAIAVLGGWFFSIDFLKRIIPGVVAMNPLTALLFVFSGMAFLFIATPKKPYKQLGKFLAILTALLGGVKLLEYGLEVQNGIDTILFKSELIIDQKKNLSNSLAINTAACFVLLGTSLYLMDKHTVSGKRIADYLATTILLISLLSIIGYLYVVDVFYAFLKKIPMAFHTSLSFFLIGQAIIYRYPNQGIMRHITSHRAGGVVARKILVAVILIPIMLGGSLLLLEWRKLFGSDFSAAIYTLGIIVLFFVICMPIIRSLNEADAAREKAEAKLLQTIEDLKTRTTQLETSNKELESFSYSISHDLRAPLRAVDGYAQILLHDYPLDEEAQKLLYIISHNGKKMGILIDSLLSFVEIAKKGIDKKCIHMQQLVTRVVERTIDSMENTPLVTIESLPPAYGDQNLILQLLEKLISNAIKYSSKKTTPQIRIGAFTQANKTVYYIKDNGDGFDMRHYDKLFMVFHRLHHQDEFDGVGIGLAIAQKIIKIHNGEIWAEATKGEGAVFYFSLDNYPQAATQKPLQELSEPLSDK